MVTWCAGKDYHGEMENDVEMCRYADVLRPLMVREEGNALES